MRSDIHMEILRRAINEMIDYHGYTANSITMESGVHNITRYLNKGMTITPENWLKLHKTFPDYIPEPVYKSDKKIYQHVESSTGVSQTGGNAKISGSNFNAGTLTSIEDQELIDMLIKYGNASIKQNLRNVLNKIKDISE